MLGNASAAAIRPPNQIQGRSEMTARRRKQKSQDQPDAKEGERVLIFNAESGDDTKPQPELRRIAVENANEQINATHPEKRLENIHRVEISDAEIHQGAERCRAGKNHRPYATAELACDQTGQCHRQRARECGK